VVLQRDDDGLEVVYLRHVPVQVWLHVSDTQVPTLQESF